MNKEEIENYLLEMYKNINTRNLFPEEFIMYGNKIIDMIDKNVIDEPLKILLTLNSATIKPTKDNTELLIMKQKISEQVANISKGEIKKRLSLTHYFQNMIEKISTQHISCKDFFEYVEMLDLAIMAKENIDFSYYAEMLTCASVLGNMTNEQREMFNEYKKKLSGIIDSLNVKKHQKVFKKLT